jgi:hypothetical protein
MFFNPLAVSNQETLRLNQAWGNRRRSYLHFCSPTKLLYAPPHMTEYHSMDV